MPEIKTREKVKDIKVLDKAAVVGERMKQAFVRSKDQAENLLDDGQVSPSEYAEDKIRYAAKDVAEDVGHGIKRGTEKTADKVRQVRRQYKEAQKTAHETNTTASRVRQARNHTVKTAEKSAKTIKQTAKSTGNASVKTAKGTVKTAEKGIKTAQQTSKAAIKTAQATAKASKAAAQATAKATKAAVQAARAAARAAVAAAKVAAKAVAAAVKAIIAAVKALIAAIAAGGWVAIVVIIVVVLIAALVAYFGIFFSGEDTGSEKTMNVVVQEINDEYQQKLEDIKSSVTYDTLEMSGSRAVWPDVLSVYAIRVTYDPDNPQEVTTITDEKEQTLREIFWEMNTIDHSTTTEQVTTIIESDDGNGNILEEYVTETKTTLHITVSHKTAAEMAEQYSFNDEELKHMNTLLEEGTSSMWAAVLYGIYESDDRIVAVALSQVGNVGGQPYWSWYGFNSRVEWCACFVSWCANECGYIDTGICPKYAGCVNGVDWFKSHNQWLDGSAEPLPGMIIFYDWDSPNGESGPQDGLSDHTGIVWKVEDGYVYTIEGNLSDSCKTSKRPVGEYQILGYGVLNP